MTVEEPQKTGHQVAALQRHCGTLTSVLQQLTDGGNGEQQEGLLTAGALSILDIKGAHRAVFEAAEAARNSTAAAKDGLEGLSLQLANLRYQRRHHESDIAACLDARSAYSEADISLLPEAEFRATAGNKWTAGLAEGDEHALNVARLQHEAAARQTLLAELQRTRARKDELAAGVAQKRRFADSLAAELGAIRDAAGPLRAALSAAPPGAALPDRAEQLPLPLYIVLTQLLAAKGAFDTPVQARVVDRQQQPAAATAAAAAAPPAAGAAAAAAAGDTEMAEAGEAAEDGAEEGEDIEDGGTPERPAAAAATAPPAASEVALEPLAVEVVLGQESARLLTVTLAYSVQHHKVYASGADADETRALAAADAPSAGSKGATTAAPAAASAGPRPLKWAQQLAGIDFLPPPPPGGPPLTAADIDGHVLAGLAEHRSAKKALRTLESLRAAVAPVAGGK